MPLPQWLRDGFRGGQRVWRPIALRFGTGGADPLGPENVIMFLTGPLTATAAPSMRACVVTKSPLTGIYLDSFFRGAFRAGNQIRRLRRL